MYRDLNLNYIRAYISYRLPFETHEKTFVGDVIPYKNIKDVELKSGFILNSFDHSKNYFVKNLKEIELTDFDLFYSDTSHFCISKIDYIRDCGSLINTLNNSDIDKVVLSRVKKIDLNKTPIDIYNQLNKTYKNSFNYLISIDNVGSWIGATPETLVEIDNKFIKTVSIAGTKTIDNKEWGEKEIEEQQMVSVFIERLLKNQLTEFKIGDTETITAGEVQHIKTEISGFLKNKNDWTKTVRALHPTPATCGLPKIKAQSIIKSIEKHDRKFYTGFLGPISENCKQLFVNLRCMEVQRNSAFLFLGGGITAQSVAKDEWNETENKAKTLLSVINHDSN